MDLGLAAAIAALAYLLGSISPTRLAMRFLAPQHALDQMTIAVPGSEEGFRVTSAGANTAAMVLGKRAGCAIGLLDMLKAFAPTLALRLLYPDQTYHLIAGTMVMVGHNWPIFHRFKGGRGYSTSFGGMLAVDWVGALLSSLAGWVAGLLVARNYVVGILAGKWFFIPLVWLTTGSLANLAYAVAVNVLFLLALIPDIKEYQRHRHTAPTDMRSQMEATPMGRSMLRLMERMNLMKK